MSVKIDHQAFEDHLVWAEGEELQLYPDSEGILTIGVGRNIQEKGISKTTSRQMLQEDIDEALTDAGRLDFFAALDPVRQLVIADMVFNMGLPRVLRFKRMIAALKIGDYNLAAQEMTDSKWYRQVGRRAIKLVEAMKTGEWKHG